MDIQRLLGFEQADITYAPLAVLPDDLRHSYHSTSDVGGTWQPTETGSLITYDPTLIRMPITLISVLAHELLHERLSWASELPPGEAEAHELNTDLHCFTTGPGGIQSQGAEAIGWQGYMRQSSRIHALALFLLVRRIDAGQAKPHLSSRANRALARAFAHLESKTNEINALQVLLDS